MYLGISVGHVEQLVGPVWGTRDDLCPQQPEL